MKITPDIVTQAEERISEVRTKLYRGFMRDMSFIEFADTLSEQDRAMVLVSSLYQQVNNGGFSQWCFNGYNHPAVIPALRDLGKAGNLVADWIEEMDASDCFDEAVFGDEDEEEEKRVIMHDFDDMFYHGTGRELLVTLAEKYFAS